MALFQSQKRPHMIKMIIALEHDETKDFNNVGILTFMSRIISCSVDLRTRKLFNLVSKCSARSN